MKKREESWTGRTIEVTFVVVCSLIAAGAGILAARLVFVLMGLALRQPF